MVEETRLKLSLPDLLEAFLEQQVASGKYASAEQYLGALVEADQYQKARERKPGKGVATSFGGPANHDRRRWRVRGFEITLSRTALKSSVWLYGAREIERYSNRIQPPREPL